jgi:DNA-binding response OmpR family regulator
MAVVLLTGDLAVMSRVEGAVVRAGQTMRAAGGAVRVVEHCVAEPVALVIVDLSTPSLDVAALIKLLRDDAGSGPRIVAFGPHVHEERLAAARLAGCDDVVSRGEFFARLDAIVGARS